MDPSVLDPFLPLITASSSTSFASGHASKARKTQLVREDTLRNVQGVTNSIGEGVNEQKTAIHDLLISPTTFPTFTSQSRTATHLLTRNVSTLSSLSSLTTTLAATTTSTQPLLNLLERRRHWEGKAAQAKERAALLKTLRRRVERLQGLEGRIRAGEGAGEVLIREVLDEVKLANVDSREARGRGRMGVLNKGKQKELHDDKVDGVVEGSKAWKVLNNRAIHLQALLQNLLGEAFGQAVAFEQDSSRPGAGSMKLRLRSRVAVSDPTNGDSIPSHQILSAISLVSPSLLPELLKKVQSTILEGFVRPVLSSDLASRRGSQGMRLLVRVDTGAERSAGAEGEVSIWLESVAAEDDPKSEAEHDQAEPEKRVFSCLARLLKALQNLYDTSNAASSDTSETLRISHSGLLAAISKEVLDSYLIPLMPKSPERLDEWAERLKDGVTFEQTPVPGYDVHEESPPHIHSPDHASTEMHSMPISSDRPTIIQDFYYNQASSLWVVDRRKEWFEQLRVLVCDGWKGWDSVQVKRERRMEPMVLPVAVPVERVVIAPNQNLTNGRADQALSAGGPPDIEVTHNGKAEDAEEESQEDGGWSFDEWEPSTPGVEQRKESPLIAPSPPPSTSPPASTAATDETSDSGWDPEESGASGVLAPLPDAEEEAPIVLKKPTRVAKRLGKGKAKALEADSNQEIQEPVEPERISSPAKAMVLSATPPVPEAPILKRQETNNWGWDDLEPAEELEILAPKAIPAALLPPRPLIIIDACTISTATTDVLSLVECSLRLSISISPSLLTDPPFVSLPSSLHQSAREVFDLFRAVMPVANKKEVDQVPSLSAQFVNDCEELARGVAGLEKQYRWDAEGAESKLRILGKITHAKQIQTQTDALLEILDDVNGFEGIAEDVSNEAYLRTIGQVKDKIEVLHRVWAHVMLPLTCLEATGALLDVAVDRITTDILAINDITAEDSERLNRICGDLRVLEGLFVEGGGAVGVRNVVNIVNYVPRWLKFCYVSELLEASLADIRYLHESGALVDFTKDELVHLLEALFTDSPLRAGAIERIVGVEGGSVPAEGSA